MSSFPLRILKKPCSQNVSEFPLSLHRFDLSFGAPFLTSNFSRLDNLPTLLPWYRLRHLRSVDRKINEMRYPTLFYPDVYLLDGGYRNFYKSHPELCEPRGYVEMQDARFVTQCEDDLSQSRKTWKRHKTLADATALQRRGSASFWETHTAMRMYLARTLYH